jgi:hypothetical protein
MMRIALRMAYVTLDGTLAGNDRHPGPVTGSTNREGITAGTLPRPREPAGPAQGPLLTRTDHRHRRRDSHPAHHCN